MSLVVITRSDLNWYGTSRPNPRRGTGLLGEEWSAARESFIRQGSSQGGVVEKRTGEISIGGTWKPAVNFSTITVLTFMYYPIYLHLLRTICTCTAPFCTRTAPLLLPHALCACSAPLHLLRTNAPAPYIYICTKVEPSCRHVTQSPYGLPPVPAVVNAGTPGMLIQNRRKP